MYINPFIAGIFLTLFSEILIIIGISIYLGIKQNKKQ